MLKGEYRQPLAVASLGGIAGLGYCLYSHRSIPNALVTAGTIWLVLFWVVLRGRKLAAQRDTNPQDPMP
ncbi:hypothetical protein EC9_41350 [Rosistilla ulvae]|uniref:Uncharacterized protein n=1 Tax=Rosistilla ulvae TaxID=1930277 RepID=A0A517M4X8_9BACT|nr:hypothetical protein EC9_41350 [Rosistilla ulvae]